MTSILLYVFRRHATKLQIFTIDHVPERHRPLNVKSLRMGQLNWDLARCSFVNYSLRLLFIIYYSRFQELSHFEKHFFFFNSIRNYLKKHILPSFSSLLEIQTFRICVSMKLSSKRDF